MDNNAYLLVCTRTGEALLIDAANEADRARGLIGAATGAQLRTIVTTHRHYDHWQALGAVAEKRRTGARAPPGRARAAGPGRPTRSSTATPIAVGRVPLEVIHLRGHTPGSIALLYRDGRRAPHLFTGDSLFPGGPGKTRLPERLRVADGRPGGAGVRPAARRDLGLPGPRRRHHARRERPHLAEWRERGW